MVQTGCERVIELLTQIYDTLQEYERQTDTMNNAGLEVIQGALIARNELIEDLEDYRRQLEDVTEIEQNEERILLKALINGSYVKAELDEQHKQIQVLQRNITIIKQRIVDKDRVISGQFKSQQMDSRRELEQLKQTKQKIGYYNSSVVGRQTGQSLNKNL